MYWSLDIPCTNVDTCISGLTAAIFNFWVISAYVTIDKDLLEFTQHKTKHTTLFYSAISRISELFTTCYHIAYFRWISPKLLIWRHTYSRLQINYKCIWKSWGWTIAEWVWDETVCFVSNVRYRFRDILREYRLWRRRTVVKWGLSFQRKRKRQFRLHEHLWDIRE